MTEPFTLTQGSESEFNKLDIIKMFRGKIEKIEN